MKSLLFLVLLLASCSRPEHAAEEKSEPEKKKIIELSEDARQKSGIKIETAGPAVLRKLVRLNGKIGANEEQMARVTPRFPGIVKSTNKKLGDSVKVGETLAVIESNESLQSYEMKSQIDGTIIKKDIALGEFVDNSKTAFVVADLKTVWVDFPVYRGEAQDLKVGEAVLIHPAENAPVIESKISYFSPVGAENTQTTLARAVVANDDGQLRPGLFVDGDVVLAEVPVPVAVKTNALQTLDEKPVVFVATAKGFEAREVETGERDDEHVEIKSGLKANESYAAENSFLLKSELARPQPGDEE